MITWKDNEAFIGKRKVGNVVGEVKWLWRSFMTGNGVWEDSKDQATVALEADIAELFTQLGMPIDTRPMHTDKFLLQLQKNCEDKYDQSDAVELWLEGCWDEALELAK